MSTVTSEEQSVGNPETPANVLQGPRQTRSETPSQYINAAEPSSHGRGREWSQRARPPVADDANPGLNEGRHSSKIQRTERESTRLGRRGHDNMSPYAQHWHRQTLRYKLERDTSRMEAEPGQRQVDRRELDDARKRADDLAKENAQLKALLETRRQELQDAQRFMGTVDTFAESEVVQEVRSLNTEVFNLARSIAEQASPDQDEDVERGVKNNVKYALGQPFFDVLESTDVQEDTILLEIAVQVAATKCLADIISTWTHNCESDIILTSVYERIRESENQSVAGQWRALTRKFAQTEDLDVETLDDSYNRWLGELLGDVMLSSGMRPSAESDPQLPTQILASKALKLRHLIGEAMKSSEYEILLPQPGAAFVAEEMEDVYHSRGDGKRTGSFVLCCASLGLQRVEKVDGRLRTATLVKPDVGLHSLVADLCLADGDNEMTSGW